MAIYTWYKNIGETPLASIERMRKEQNIEPGIPMTYAGRLDPFVEGLMIVLTGEDCKTKDQYNKLSKTYEFEILSGVSTDTYDLLGLVTKTNFQQKLHVEKVHGFLEENKKTITQSYPPYSSKTVDGKQLHTHAREGNTPTVTHEVTLHSYQFLEERTIPQNELQKIILERIHLVHGDFRQEEIKKEWNKILEKETETIFQITKWRVHVSSGFYIRQLVQDIGTFLEIPTVTFYIKRIEIENFQ